MSSDDLLLLPTIPRDDTNRAAANSPSTDIIIMPMIILLFNPRVLNPAPPSSGWDDDDIFTMTPHKIKCGLASSKKNV